MRKFVVNVNGNSYQVEVEEIGAGESVQVVSAPKAAPAAPVAKPAVKGSGEALKSPMPGMLMKFLVNEGDTVKKGQAVAILEAMKMENEIAACADGKITFATQKGANVDTGDILAYIG